MISALLKQRQKKKTHMVCIRITRLGNKTANYQSFPYRFSIPVNSCYAEDVVGYNKAVILKQKHLSSKLKIQHVSFLLPNTYFFSE